MHYLFLGDDSVNKDQKLRKLKKKILTSANAREFDFQLLHGHKLDPDELKQALISLPVVAKQRLVVIRTIHKLSPHNKKLILEYLGSGQDHAVLVLDTDENDPKNSFITKLKAYTNHFNFSSGKKDNVFDMTRAMSSRDPVRALKILSELMEQGEHPLKIMGGLVWYWGNSKRRLSADKFRQGLTCLQQADMNIKRSRMKPEHILEVLVVKLSSLIAC